MREANGSINQSVELSLKAFDMSLNVLVWEYNTFMDFYGKS